MNLGLIGLGSMGQNYLKTAKELKDISIKYICAKNNLTLNKFSDEYHKLNNYKELAELPVDGVIIATPASTHFEIASFFLKKGIPLLIEKPLINNLEEAIDLLNLQKNTPVLAGFTLLYHRTYLEIKKQIAEIGQIKSLEFIGENNNPRKDTSLLLDWGSHGIALFLDLLGSDPIESKIINLSRENGLILNLEAQLHFPDNTEAYLKISWQSRSKVRQLIIKGAKKTLIMDDIINPFMPLGLELEDFKNAILGRPHKSDLKFGVKVMRILDNLNELSEQFESP